MFGLTVYRNSDALIHGEPIWSLKSGDFSRWEVGQVWCAYAAFRCIDFDGPGFDEFDVKSAMLNYACQIEGRGYALVELGDVKAHRSARRFRIEVKLSERHSVSERAIRDF